MKTLSQDRRKYLIIEALRALPVEVDEHTRMALPLELKVSEQTFNEWLNLAKSSETDIPAQKLLYIAMRLGKKVEELYNERPTVRPYLTELKDPTNLMNRFNLSN